LGRELHDQTVQALGGLRVLLASSLRHLSGEAHAQISQAVEDVEVETDNLRGIIADLRPSLLDDLGLLPAIEARLERRRDTGLEIDSHVEVPGADAGAELLSPELGTTLYRFVQEALTNVSKHARGDRASVSVKLEGGAVLAEVSDDGVGFDTAARTLAFGLAGMRERIYLTGGNLEITSGPNGTTVSARIPLSSGSSFADPVPEASDAEQIVS